MIGFGEIYRRAIPLAIAEVSLVSLVFTDMLMLGHNSAAEMAVGSLAMQIFIVVLVLGEGVVFGFGPVYGPRLDDPVDRKSVILSAFLCIILYSLVFLLLIKLFDEGLGNLFAGVDNRSHAYDYIILLSISLLPNLMFILLWEVFAFDEKEWVVIVGALTQFLVNLVANYALIYGELGFPRLGLIGAGYATVLASISGCIVFFLFAGSSASIVRHSMSTWIIQWPRVVEHMWSITKIGLPYGISIACTIGFLSHSTALMARFGAPTLAAHSAIVEFNEVIVVFALGFAEFAAIYSASNGMLPRHLVAKDAYKIICAATITVVPVIALAILFNERIPSLFFSKEDPLFADIVTSVDMLHCVAFVSVYFNVVILIIQGTLRGLGETWRPAVMVISAYWLFGTPVQFFLLSLYPNQSIGIWIGMLSGFAAAALMLVCELAWERKRKVLSS